MHNEVQEFKKDSHIKSDDSNNYYYVNKIDENNVLSIMNYSTKLLFINKNDSKRNNTESQLARTDTVNGEMMPKSKDEIPKPTIHRGFSARRYVNNLTKNWDQDVLDKFISNGKINEQTIYDRNNKMIKEAKRKRIDDLTQFPQAYKLDRSLLSELNSNRMYKFIKIDHSFNSQSNEGNTQLASNNNLTKRGDEATDANLSTRTIKSTKPKVVNLDSIKIIDKNSTELNYKVLNANEKRKVLSDLLYQSAVSNIIKNQIVNFHYLCLF